SSYGVKCNDRLECSRIPLPTKREDLVEVEANGAAELVAGELAALPLVENRRRLEAETLGELAGGQEAVAHLLLLLGPAAIYASSSASLGFVRLNWRTRTRA